MSKQRVKFKKMNNKYCNYNEKLAILDDQNILELYNIDQSALCQPNANQQANKTLARKKIDLHRFCKDNINKI